MDLCIDARDYEVNQAIVKDKLDDLRPITARVGPNAELHRRQSEHKEVKTHSVNECRSQNMVFCLRDGAACPWYPNSLEENPFVTTVSRVPCRIARLDWWKTYHAATATNVPG